MNQSFYEMVESNPVIAAVKDMEGLEKCCRLKDIKVVFILFGDICSIPEIVSKIKEAGQMAVVHVDLISGLSFKEIAVDYVKKNTRAVSLRIRNLCWQRFRQEPPRYPQQIRTYG